MKSKDQKDSELQMAKTLSEEANERLSQEIKNKNFNTKKKREFTYNGTNRTSFI